MIIILAIKLKMNDFHPDKVSGVNKDMIISQFDDDKMNEYKDKLSTDDADIMESALNKIIKKDKIVHKENKNQKLLYAIPQKKSKIDIPKKTYPKRHRKEVYSDVTSDLKKENEGMSSLVKNIPVLTPATTKVATPTKTKIVAPMKTKIATSVKTKITTPKITKFATPKTRFSCQQCGESFFRKLQLKIHMKVHAQEKNRLKAAAEYNIQVSTSLISINDTTKSKRKACYVAPTNSKGGMSVLSTSDAAPQKSVTESENGIENRCTMESYMEDVPLPSKILNNALAEDFKDNLNTQSENMDFPSVNVLTVPDISSADNLDIKSNESIEVILDSDEPNIKKIQKEKLFQCHDCDQEFKRRDYLRDHMITSHDGVKPFQCEICHKGFVRRNVLNNHMRSHTGEKPFQCSQCDKAFAHKSNLRSHIKLHTGERPFKCDICEKTFCAKSNLASHAKIHAGVKPHKCPECDQAFIHMDTLKKHMMVHTGERPFKCSVCEKAFRRNTHLTIHMRHHNNVRPFQCELCDKAFFEKSVLQSHMTQHTGIKPFQCDLCEKSFCHRSTLNIHLQIHRGERLFHCSVCQKSFCDKTTLIRHIRIHTGEKPFKCDVCNLHFRQSSNLKRHTRIHTGERPFKCTYCDKLFAQNINLTNHMRVHTGEKPFICGTCNKAFTQRSNLISHQKSHAGEDHVVEVYADYPRSSENNLDKEVNTFKIRGTNVSISLGNIEGGTDDAEVQRKLRIIGQKIADNVNQNKGFYIRTLVKNNSTEHEEESGSESNKVELEDHAESVLQTLISHNIGDLMDSRKVIVTNSDDDMPIITNYGSHSIKILPEQDKSSALGNFVVSHIPSCSKLAEHKKQIDDQSEHDYVEDEQEGNGFIIRDQSESVTMVQDDNGSVLYVDEEDIRDVSDKDHVYLEATDLQDGNLYVENHEDDEIYVESSDAGQEYTQNSVHINSSQVEGNALIGQDIISQDLLRQVESYVVRNYNQETYEQLLSVAAHAIPTAVENQPEHAYYENGYITSHEETIESAGSAVADDMQELLHYAVSQTVETTNEDAQ